MSELLDFLWAVANNWAGYATGGLLVAGLWLYVVLRDKPVPRKFALGFAGLCLLMACFKAWKEERAKANEYQTKFSSLSLPQLEPHIDQLLVAPAGPQGQESLITFTASVINKGSPSILGKIHSYIVLSGGGEIPGQYISPPEEGIKLRLGFGNSGQEIVFQGKDYLPTKAINGPVPTGGAVHGYYQALFAIPTGAIMHDGTYLHLAFVDINGKAYDAKTSIGAHDTAPPDIRHLQDFMNNGENRPHNLLKAATVELGD